MSRSTGPILAVGGITLVNSTIFHDKPMDWRIPVATAVTAGAFALLEKAFDKAAVGLAWMALIAVLLTRVDPKVPAPVETLNAYFTQKGP